MAGRNRMLRHPMHDGPQGFRDGPPHRGPEPMPLHPLEEEIAVRDMEIRRLLADQQHLIDENVGRNRELGALKGELHTLGQAIPKLRAEKESLTREHIQKCLKLEADLRALEPLKAEAAQKKIEALKLDSQCQELSTKSQVMSQDLKRLQAENQQLSAMKVELDGLRQEVMLARTACEYERKSHTELLDQRQLMENNLISMAREIEKLRAEHRNMEKRASGSTNLHSDSILRAGGSGYFSSLGDGYSKEKGLYSAGAPYDLHGVPRH